MALRRPLDGSTAATATERLREVIFGVEGACEHCQPRRVPATRAVKVRVEGTKILAEIDETEPYDTEYYLCGPHAATVIDDHLEPQPPGDEITLVEVRDL